MFAVRICAVIAMILLSCLSSVAALTDKEPNDTRQQASVIATGSFAGKIGDGDTTDYYVFSVKGGDVVKLSLSSDSSPDITLRLADHEDGNIEFIDPGGSVAYITAVEMGKRKWHVQVKGSGTYTFNLETIAQDDGGSKADAPASWQKAPSIKGNTVAGLVGNDDKQDSYVFEIKAGDTADIRIMPDFATLKNSDGALEVLLQARDGSNLESARTTGEEAILKYGPVERDEAGKMVISVSGTGRYTLIFSGLMAADVAAESSTGKPDAVAQAPNGGESVEFGGAGKFNFPFYVSSRGKQNASIQWTNGVQAEAFLFSPAQKTPVVKASGNGSVKLEYAVPADKIAMGEWMVQLVTSQAVKGSVTLAHEEATGAANLKWNTLTPKLAVDKAFAATWAQSATRIKTGKPPANRLERQMADKFSSHPEYKQDIALALSAIEYLPEPEHKAQLGVAHSRITGDSLSVESAIADQGVSMSSAVAEASSVQSQSDAMGSTGLSSPTDTTNTSSDDMGATQADTNTSPSFLRIRFNKLVCAHEMTWDRGTDSDEIYYLLALLDSNGEAKGFASHVYGDMDSGENRPEGNFFASDVIWSGEITMDTRCIVQVMENDDGRPQRSLTQFLNAAEDSFLNVSVSGMGFGSDATFGQRVGEGIRQIFGWWLGGEDDMIGEVYCMPTVITPALVASWKSNGYSWGNSGWPGYTWAFPFIGGGARYSVWLTFGP